MKRFRKARYSKEAKNIPMRASDGDSGREEIDKGNFFRCWHCGFICDIRRDELSKDGRRGTAPVIQTTLQPDRSGYNRGSDAIKLDVGAGHDIVLLENNADGNPKTIYQVQTASVNRGCPLCGTTVWKKP